MATFIIFLTGAVVLVGIGVALWSLISANRS